MPVFEFISNRTQNLLRRVPHRVKVCGLATGVVLFCYTQRVSYLAWVNRIHDVNTVNRIQNKSNCTYIITSWEEHFKRYESLPDFYWDTDVMRAITQFFYLGYMLSVIPAGIAVDFYGPRFLLLLGFFISSVSTIAFPFMAKVSPFGGMAATFCQGLGQGTLYAGIAVLTVHWSPVRERTRFVSVTESGQMLGVLLAALPPLLFPVLVTRWELRFVLSGLLGLLLLAACWLFLCGRPTDCKHISAEEKDYIHQHTDEIVHKEGYKFPFVPWKRMVLTPCFLSLFFYSSTTHCFHTFILARIDKYMLNFVHFDKKLVSAVLLYGVVCTLVCTWFWGVTSDLLMNKKYLSRTANRKLSGLIAMSISVPTMLLILAAGCDGVLVVASHAALFFSRGFVYSTVHAIPIDLSPQYTGTTMAIANFGGCFATMLARELYFNVVVERSDSRQWWTLVSIVTAASVVGTLQFLVLGSAEVQSWNYAEPRNSRQSTNLTLGAIISRASTRSRTPVGDV